MAISASIKLNQRQFTTISKMIDRLSPGANPRIWKTALTRMAGQVANTAKTKTIVSGRGLKSKPLPRKLSFRLGQLAGSIIPDFAQIPKRVLVVTHAPYGGVHEGGLTVTVPAHSASNDRGTSWIVRQHTARFPRRPFLAPALVDSGPKFVPITLQVLREQIRGIGI